MDIYKLTGRNIEITDALREYVENKLSRLERYSDSIVDARVTLSVRDGGDAMRRNRIEVQLNVPGGIIRAEETHSDMYAAIDRASDVLERQLRKFKTRYMKQRHDERPATPMGEAERAAENGEGEEFAPEVVRTKRFELRPMSAEDAVVQMEALGHDFYVFKTAQNQNTAVVYRRRDGNYGLIEPH